MIFSARSASTCRRRRSTCLSRLALFFAFGVWLLIYRSRLGNAIRTVGASPAAAVYAGISPARITMLTMALSGALAAGLALNEVLGVQQRLLPEFTSGYGFVGIAVALMGRAHPLGVVLAALLFGMLYQGGAELSFDHPTITRDMVTVIGGVLILFAGAFDGLFRRGVAGLMPRRAVDMRRQRRRRGLCGGGFEDCRRPMDALSDLSTLIAVVLASALRLSVPLIAASLAGLWSERSGIVDIGLEGKMLIAAFASAAAAYASHSAWVGLGAGILASVAFALLHGFASISQRGNQIVSGVAINLLAAGLTAVIGNAWYGEGGRTPPLEGPRPFPGSRLAGRRGAQGRADPRVRSMPMCFPGIRRPSILRCLPFRSRAS